MTDLKLPELPPKEYAEKFGFWINGPNTTPCWKNESLLKVMESLNNGYQHDLEIMLIFSACAIRACELWENVLAHEFTTLVQGKASEEALVSSLTQCHTAVRLIASWEGFESELLKRMEK